LFHFLHPKLSERGTFVPPFRGIPIRRMTIDYRILVGETRARTQFGTPHAKSPDAGRAERGGFAEPR
jgi:hypothetical protein